MLDKKSFLILALVFMLSGMGLASQSYASELERFDIPLNSPSFYEDWQEPTSLYGKPLEVAKAKLVTGIYEGQPVIALRLIMSAGWHSYWYFPGAAGIAPRFEWGASPYFSVGEPLFLPPKRFKEPGGPTYGYDGDTVIFIPLTFKGAFENRDETAFSLSLTLTLGLCKDICIPASFTFSEHITLKDIRNSLDQKWVSNALTALPKPSNDELFVKEISFFENNLQVAIAGENLTRPDVFIAGRDGDFFDEPEIVSKSSTLWIFSVPAVPVDGDFSGRVLEFVVQDTSGAVFQTRRVQSKKSVNE
ncbi:MAG: hypothetical protein CBE09_05130 [Rhizobiales bacterium TMED249]|mgnify:FL=1|uniref:Thiol:disulfide interchange protein DsbD N-terminal domain-containing protein n=1 Tax=PS1 clade bacterium TaxID=2175152 RepID=A0A368E0Y4_9PROT|nr:MAG: hypothetical protein CBE09_05130 [Rhizobiales bacterium TMED249]RCL77760.1 MAG: hypothetical protein DBW69_02250 [PS1 clade bacterium]HAK99367.1 hypothetical protein [Rhodobiaceae bacterium]HCV49449.1 hypothetical protein [Rhodobiaceae bacterium]|tara:strand:+ start:39002 stop:39913 length:912 start_codon:yes stop_codon:yes gene_type:complete